MGCTVGFRAILNQRLAFTTLDENLITHALYLSARSCDAMCRLRESKSRIELFYRLFIDHFCHIFLALRLNTCLNGVWNYCYVYRSDLTPFKCWSGFHFFLGLLASFVHVQLNTGIWQAIIACATSLRKTVVRHLKQPPSGLWKVAA